MYTFDIAAKKWANAKPEGTGCPSRDAAYVPGQDAVVAHAGSGRFKVYLCGENRWVDGPTAEKSRRGMSEHAVTIDPATGLVLFIRAQGFCQPFDLFALRLNRENLNK